MLTGNKGIEVGDVFVSLWGYEQTNASYYQVIKIVGKTMVEVLEINKKAAESNNARMTSKVKPVPNSFKDKPSLRKKIHRYGRDPLIEINSYSSATLIHKVNGEYPTVETSSYY